MSFHVTEIILCARCNGSAEIAALALRRGWAVFEMTIGEDQGPAEFGLCPTCVGAFRSFIGYAPLAEELPEGR